MCLKYGFDFQGLDVQNILVLNRVAESGKPRKRSSEAVHFFPSISCLKMEAENIFFSIFHLVSLEAENYFLLLWCLKCLKNIGSEFNLSVNCNFKLVMF